MSNYIVAIPSYKRENVLVTKTLKTLKDGGVPSSKIQIFVANTEERDNYENAVPKDLYDKIVVGVKGITEQRKFIIKHFPEKQYVVSIDDDVERLEKMKGDKLAKITNVDKFFKDAHADMTKNGLYIWGIYPVRNPFFMKPNVSTGLKFIIGTMYGFINRHDKSLEPSSKIKEKEDVEQSILYYLKGGLGKTEGRFENNKVAAAYLAKTYPDLVSVFHRKNGMAEIRLKRTPGKNETKKSPKSKKNKTAKNM
jgi:hypothetical protein